MALLKPLVFDAGRGVSRQLDPADALDVSGDLQVAGKLGFNGATPQGPQSINGDWGQSLGDLVNAFVLLGLLQDKRTAGWQNGINSVALMGAVGPYEPGRLIIGSTTGWMPLDQPALVPGVIQAPISHAGPPETSPVTGLAMRTLAYSPILSYGTTAPPTTALAGALWFNSAAGELFVFDGTTWRAATNSLLRALQQALTGAAKGSVLLADGKGGISSVTPVPGDSGQVLVFDGAQHGHFIDLILRSNNPPWPNGASSSDPRPGGGGRPAGLDQAIWCNPLPGAETIGFWNEASLRWLTTPVNNPVINRLAELRNSIANGDLLTVKASKVDRLPIGVPGEALVVNAAGELGWHDRFHAGPSAPAGAIDGDLWLDDTTQTVRVRENNRWLAFNEVERFTDLNATGGAIVPGTPLVHGSPSWILAGPVTAPGSFIAIALSAAASGTRVAAGVGGIVTLSEAEWSAVIDNAEIRVVGGGLSAGRDYYVSSLSAGLLTTKPANGIGIAVGTALSSTSLLLRNSPMRSSALPTAAHIGPTPPPGRNGELWWSTIKGDLFIYFDDGTSSQWVSATADGTTTTTTTGGTPAPLGPAPGGPAPLAAAVNAVVSLEAIDWVSDPLAAAIRVHLADGSTTSLRIRGAGGTVVTMADNQTLVIDAGGGRIPSNAGTPGAGTSGAGTGTPGAGTPPTATPTGTLAPGNGVLADPITNMITTIDEGWL